MKFIKPPITETINRQQNSRLSLQEDEISNGNTEDLLLNSRSNSDIINSDDIAVCPSGSKRKGCGCLSPSLIFGILFIAWGIESIFYTPFDFLMDERIKMLRGLPPYEWWKNTPEEVILQVYIFNITNSMEFLNGTDTKLKVEEIGPIVYSEKLVHTNVTFNDNGTLTYVATRKAIYLPEMNTVDLNATIIVPNLGVLVIPSYMYDASFFTKFGINLLVRRLNSQPLVKTTVYKYLWNITDPILDVANQVAPFIAPTRNFGILARIYDQFVDTVTVYVGSKYGHEKFFLIDQYDGSDRLPGFGGICLDKVTNSTEGICYPQKITKNTTLRYFRKSICKVMELSYDSDVNIYGVQANKFLLSPKSYNRIEPFDRDCFKGVPTLPDGLVDIAPCYFEAPIATSFPHFLYGHESLKNYVEGLNPDVDKHQSYLIVEPNTGVPLQGRASSQSNLIMRKLSGFNSRLQIFSDMIIPLCWIEYYQVGIPWYVEWLMYFLVIVVPPGQKVLTTALFILGTYYIYSSIKRKKTITGHLVQNKTIKFESEPFMKI